MRTYVIAFLALAALAAPRVTSAATTAPVVVQANHDPAVTDVYYYNGRHYPYRHNGRYYPYSYNHHYYNHRYWQHGRWYYY